LTFVSLGFILKSVKASAQEHKIMKSPTQKQLDKMPKVSKETLANTSGSIRNYYVYLGTTCSLMMIPVHVGLGSTNHFATIQEIVKHPIFKVLIDNRKMTRLGIGEYSMR